jgi:ubiquitin-conjugating enzyme E2 S
MKPISQIYKQKSKGRLVLLTKEDASAVSWQLRMISLITPQKVAFSVMLGFFITKIFHPNVSEKGEICVNTLKKDWDPTNWSLYNIFEVVKCLLIVPFPESALNEQAGKLFMDNYGEYFKHAKLITSLYATPKELKTLENVNIGL